MEATQKKSALSVNMTEGSLWKNMLLFSLPLMLTQVLEVLFNLSDVAIAGKFGGAMFSARFVGESWKDSLYIGALMNTRGLMELVVLTIGYEMAFWCQQTFAVRLFESPDYCFSRR